jgi:hypothetical protein
VLVIPSSTVQVQPVDIYTILGCRQFIFLVVDSPIFKGKSIDGNFILAGVGLQYSSEETLWEEKTAHPVTVRGSFVEPIIDEGYSLLEIFDPRRKRFE